MRAEPAELEALEGLARNYDANDIGQHFGVEAIHEAFDGREMPPTLPLADLSAWSTSQPSPKQFVMAGHIPKGEVTKLDGPGGSNKSTAVQQLITCRAAGKPFLGLDLEPGVSLYVSAEDDFDRLEWMHQHICAAIGVARQSLVGKMHLSSVRGRLNNELAAYDSRGELVPSRAFRDLKATIEATGADLVGLDNVAHLYTAQASESDRGQVTAFVNLLYSLGVTVILIGHPNKQHGQGNKQGNEYSGSTAWLNAIRSQLVIDKPDELDPDARVLKVGKANYARPGGEIGFRWHDFALWRPDDLPTDVHAEIAKAARVSGENEVFLACLRARNAQGDGRQVGPAPGPNYAPSQFEGMREAKGLKRKALKAAMDRLFAIEAIESHTYRNTSKGRDVTIIREVPEPPRTPTPNPSRTLTPDHPEQSAQTTPHTHSITKVISGAASEVAAPVDKPVGISTAGGEGVK